MNEKGEPWAALINERRLKIMERDRKARKAVKHTQTNFYSQDVQKNGIGPGDKIPASYSGRKRSLSTTSRSSDEKSAVGDSNLSQSPKRRNLGQARGSDGLEVKDETGLEADDENDSEDGGEH